MSLAWSWTPGAGACHVEATVPVLKSCALSDWQTSGATCFVDAWRLHGASAELDVTPNARTLVPELVRTPTSKTKALRRTRSRADQGPSQQQQQKQQCGSGRIADVKGCSKLPRATNEVLDSEVLSLGLPVPSLGASIADVGSELSLSSHAAEHSKNLVEQQGVVVVEQPGAPNVAAATTAGATVQEGSSKETSSKAPPPPLSLEFDFVVVGSGIAGLRFALDVAKHGSVAVVTKSERQEGSTNYAQGGVSAVLDPGDSVEEHIRDTIVAGAYLNDEEVVEVVCREGPDRVRELMAMGASFDKGEDGRLLLTREGGHSHHRIVHAADVTGREIQRALLVAVQKCPSITLFEHHFAVDLITFENDEGVRTCHGVDALDVRTGVVQRFLAPSTLLASGGAGHVYPNTTNPVVATGDGVALAQRCQAVISNMEFVQFHPTALADSGLPCPPTSPRSNSFLISEAVRGSGGLLYNQSGERFMPDYDARAELAPRDVVARSIDDQLKKRGEKFVWLDISHCPDEEVLVHFPNIAEECRRCGIDITKEPIPVVPAAHYMCGGVQTGLQGETSVQGLWAAGEVACTGLHGANRLASNSLLEALVFAQRAVDPAVAYALDEKLKRQRWVEEPESMQDKGNSGLASPKLNGNSVEKMELPLEEGSSSLPVWSAMPRAQGLPAEDERAIKAAAVTAQYRRELQGIMWDYVGIVRSTDRLFIAREALANIAEEWKEKLAVEAQLPAGTVTVQVCEMRNLLAVAMLIVQSALSRHESRGLHFTTDFPDSLESERLPTVLSAESFALWPGEGNVRPVGKAKVQESPRFDEGMRNHLAVGAQDVAV